MQQAIAPFDPTAAFFMAQESRPAHLEDIDFAGLPPVLRMLLVKDGTVTTAICAYFLEEVSTRQIGQQVVQLTAADRWLDLPAGAEVLRRQVMLQSAVDERLFVFAESLIAVERLPANMQQALAAKNSNLGRILREDRSETLREGLWFGRERIDALPEPVARLCDGDFMSRSYRVVTGAAPMMIVTERFPMRSFENQPRLLRG